MNRPIVSTRSALACLVLAAAPRLLAQTSAAPVQPDAAKNQVASASEEETVVLSPFSVTAEAGSEGYAVKDTLAGTRVRTELKDVASAITVVNKQFLTDTGAKNTQDLLVYTTNTEVGGIYGNYSGQGGGTTYSETSNLLRPSANTRVRGLDSADNTRDYFLSDIPWDGYNVDRVDMQRGPNSILFGVGSPAGIINTSLNGAGFKTVRKFENRVGSFGTVRNSIDINQSVLKNELGVRVAAVDDNTKYQQKPAYNHDRRVYAALRYDPKLIKDGHTSIKINYEAGKVDANRPRSLPAIDAITPWFQTGTSNGYANLNKMTLDPTTTYNQYYNNTAYPSSVYPWFHEAFMGRLMSSNIANYYDATNSAPLYSRMPNLNSSMGIDSTGTIDGTISGNEFSRPYGISTYNAYARACIVGGKYYSNKSLTDRSIFDYFNNLIDGDNKKEWQKFKASNINLSQTFLNDRVGVEFVYDYQRYEDGQYAFLNGDQYSISVDINSKLIDGSVNPNVGRAYVGSSGQYGNSLNYIDHDAKRATGYADLRSEDLFGKGVLSKILGNHVLTGILSSDTKRTDYRKFSRWAASTEWAEATGQSTSIKDGARQIDWIAYLGGSLVSANSASNANLSAVTATINPSGYEKVTYYSSKWKATSVDPSASYTAYSHDATGALVADTNSTQSENPANYVGWTTGSYKILNADTGDLDSLYYQGQKSVNRTNSQGITWQGHLFGGNVVPIFGWRKDIVKNASSSAPTDANDVANMNYKVDGSDANTNRAEGQSRSYGLVVHTPKKYRNTLPWGTHFSLSFNKSSNFKADTPRGDVFGQKIDNPQGDTKDYGIVMTTLHDKLTVKLNFYETKMKNATLSGDSAGFSSSLYYVWALPYWGATHALAALDGISDPQKNQGSWGWPWNGIATDSSGNPDKVKIAAVVKDFFTNFPLSQSFCDEYGLGLDVSKMHSTSSADWYNAVTKYAGASNLGLQPAYGGYLKSFGAAPTASVDTTSKGVEIEVTASPVRNWNFTVNASKTTAVRTSISPTIDAWITTYTKFLAGDAGLLKLWGGDTFRKAWENNILAPYSVLKNQQGSQAAEVAPWRLNLVNNYSFQGDLLRGYNVGMAYRWEDKKVLGYQYSSTLDTLDISKPWYGPTTEHFDLWVGYGKKLTRKIDWRIQLNLRNVLEKTKLTPVTINPDGEVALSRIQEGMTWQLTNTFTF